MSTKVIYCNDDKHETPCPLPCAACAEECPPPVFYECGACEAYHPWGFTGDCRDDANRFADVPDYAVVRSAEDRGAADRGEVAE